MPPEIFRFLADSIDGTDKSTAAAAYRLSSVARGDRQTLREAIREEAAEKEDLPYPYEISAGVELDKESRKARSRSASGGNFRQEEFLDEEEQVQTASEKDYPADRSGASSADRNGAKKKRKRRAKESDEEKPLSDRDIAGKAAGRSPSAKKQIVIRIILILFALCGAGGLLTAQFLLYISRRERRL